MYILDMLKVEEDEKKMTVLMATYYILRLLVLDDLDNSMNEEQVADVQIGIMIADLAKHFEEQQSGRMRG